MATQSKTTRKFTARYYQAVGLFPFPLESPRAGVANSGKTPRWKRWQDVAATADEADLRFWEANGWNLGLHMGLSRLVALDADTPEADAWIFANLPLSPWRTRTAKGHHHFYRLADDQAVPSNGVRVHPLGVDRRSGGGYVVAPGSKHWTGVVYAAEGDWSVSIQDLPVYDPSWFNESPLPKQVVSFTLPVGADAMKVKRAQAYLRAIPAAIEGQGGDFHTYRTCCRLVRDFDLNKDEALSALNDWNAGCLPPWDALDLEKKVENAIRYSRGQAGALLRSRIS